MVGDDKKIGQKQELVDWNLSSEIIRQCGVLLDSATINFSKGRFDLSYINFKSIRKLIVFKLNSEELKDMKEKEKVLDIFLSSIVYIRNKKNPNRDPQITKEINKHKKILNKINPLLAIEDYQEALMIAMNTHGFMIGIKQDITKVGW